MNLQYSALKLEKRGNQLRFLYAANPYNNFFFKEIKDYDFDIDPKYVGIFAMKGFFGSSPVIPVAVQHFGLKSLDDKH